MQLLSLYFLLSILLYQVYGEQNITTNNTDIHKEVPKKRLMMLRNLHMDPKQGNGTMHVVIHKVKPGDPYYKVFGGDDAKAREFTNKIWGRLFKRYNTMLI
ncbi:hypothetical protein KR009_009369 [Drosophila setifemur]|nr:hypothetical protein KR009_009369 [Drosophila setifemur]